jgi:hypothetical protein
MTLMTRFRILAAVDVRVGLQNNCSAVARSGLVFKLSTEVRFVEGSMKVLLAYYEPTMPQKSATPLPCYSSKGSQSFFSGKSEIFK